MLIRLRAAVESFRSSLFFVPLLFILASVGLAQGILLADIELRQAGITFPVVFQATVDSARSLLSVIATATITVAGIAFSVALLLFQLASSEYSPRVLHGLFRDPFTKRVLGLVVGTFTYCLFVLRSVRDAVESAGQAVIPNLSVQVALVLGLLSILAIVAFIDHTAHAMDATEIIRRITADIRKQIARLAPDPQESDGGSAPEAPDPPDDALVVAAQSEGWVQQVHEDGLLDAADDGGTIRMEAAVGDFLPEGGPLCSIWPPPENADHARKEALEAIGLGRRRTMQQDLAFGIRQLVDVALRALSPSVNDPTTAGEVIAHLGAVLWDLLPRDLPTGYAEDDRGRRLFRPREPGHDRLIELAFEQIRNAGAGHPAVLRQLIETIGPLSRHTDSAGHPGRAEALRRQARLALEAAETKEYLPEDLESLREQARREGLLEDA